MNRQALRRADTSLYNLQLANDDIQFRTFNTTNSCLRQRAISLHYLSSLVGAVVLHCQARTRLPISFSPPRAARPANGLVGSSQPDIGLACNVRPILLLRLVCGMELSAGFGGSQPCEMEGVYRDSLGLGIS